MSDAVPPLLRATLPPAPEPGSARYFALLYTPAERRPALARLLALADEIGTGIARGLDHELAHARLDWWRHEAGQYAVGRAQHPWLRSLPEQQPGRLQLDLHSLLEAAALDLAEGLQRPYGGERLRRALFAAAAEVLGAGPLSPALRDAIGALGALTWEFERAPSAAPTADAVLATAALQPVLDRLGAAQQPKLAPLLVWAALAARRAKNTSLLQGFADNIRAWSVARRAIARTFTSR